MAIADIGRGRHPHSTDEAGGEVGQDVAEHVLSDQDVEIPGTLHQHQRAGVNIEPLRLHVRMELSDLVENLAEVGEGLEDIRFIDAAQNAGTATGPTPLGELEGEVEETLGGLAGDDERLARLLMCHHTFAHRGKQALGRLADDDEVNAALRGADDRARHARDQPRRPHPGIEIEVEAQLDLRRDLGVVGVAHRGQAAGAEQDRVRLFAETDRGLGDRHAGRQIIAGAGLGFREAERQARFGLDLAQNFKSGRHDLGPDAVAGQNCDVK